MALCHLPVWGHEPPRFSSGFGHPPCSAALHAPPVLRGSPWKGSQLLTYTHLPQVLREMERQDSGTHRVCLLAKLGRVGGPRLALVNWLRLRKTKGKLSAEASVCLWTVTETRGSISLQSSAQGGPSISRCTWRLCLTADRASPKGFLCSLFKMTYDGPGLISVPECIFCALSPPRDSVLSNGYVQDWFWAWYNLIHQFNIKWICKGSVLVDEKQKGGTFINLKWTWEMKIVCCY